jgi:hypothetical protein
MTIGVPIVCQESRRAQGRPEKASDIAMEKIAAMLKTIK